MLLIHFETNLLYGRYIVPSTKYVILVIGCFLLLHSTIGVQRSKLFPNPVFRTSYFILLLAKNSPPEQKFSSPRDFLSNLEHH